MTSAFFWAMGALSAGVMKMFPISTANNHIDSILGPSLSNPASIHLPGSVSFKEANTRWNAASTPQFEAIVQVQTEEDVTKTIQYANTHGHPFLAIAGGHGQSSTLKNVKNGIGIWMHDMNQITIVDNGTAALIGGGVFNGDLVTTLWAHGKQTMSTGCDCVGFIPPVLGGGHGWLQGRYGLASDQLISARMVLANGTAITVSESQHNELFWAIRGAGHNFGIATEIKIKIYDREPEQDQWAASGFVYTQDKMEDVFAVANTWLESAERPKELIHYGVFAFNPEVDAEKPLVILWVYYQGPAIPTTYTDPLYALSPLVVDKSVTDLAGVNTHLQATKDGISCAKGFSRALYPVSLYKWSLPNLRKVLDIFTNMPAAYRSSVVMFEGYATNRVGEIPDDSSAFPNRGEQLLVGVLLSYAVDSSLDAGAEEIGTAMRAALLEGTGLKLNAYVNYARGDESLEAMYGYESWRLEKLRRLKNEYDPKGRFNFYGPIV